MTSIVRGMYRAMLKAHGPRGWWPVFRKGAGPDAAPEYDPGRKSLTAAQRFEIAVGAILTQNTAWSNVKKALTALRRAGALSPDAILRAPSADVGALIRPSGYFNQKTIKLKTFSKILGKHFANARTIARFAAGSIAAVRARLLAVKGVGPETADSILLYALGKPIFVVDAYTRRIFRRHGWIAGDEPYDEIREMFESTATGSAAIYNDYHAQIVETGKRYCHRRGPECLRCPLFRREFFASDGGFESPPS